MATNKLPMSPPRRGRIPRGPLGADGVPQSHWVDLGIHNAGLRRVNVLDPMHKARLTHRRNAGIRERVIGGKKREWISVTP